MDESHGSIMGYSQPLQLRYVFLWIFQPLQLPGPFVHLRSVLDLRPVASILRLVQRWVRCIKVPLSWRCLGVRWKGWGDDSLGISPPQKKMTWNTWEIENHRSKFSWKRILGFWGDVFCFEVMFTVTKNGLFFLDHDGCLYCGVFVGDWSKALGSLAEVKI